MALWRLVFIYLPTSFWVAQFICFCVFSFIYCITSCCIIWVRVLKKKRGQAVRKTNQKSTQGRKTANKATKKPAPVHKSTATQNKPKLSKEKEGVIHRLLFVFCISSFTFSNVGVLISLKCSQALS